MAVRHVSVSVQHTHMFDDVLLVVCYYEAAGDSVGETCNY